MRVEDSGSRFQGAGFRVQESGCRVQGSGFRVQGSGFRVQGSGFRVQGSGFRAQGLGSHLGRTPGPAHVCRPLGRRSTPSHLQRRRRRVLYCQPTGPNPLNHRDDFIRPTLRRGCLNSLFQVA